MNTAPKHLTMNRWVSYSAYGWFAGIVLVVGFSLVMELLFSGQAAVGIGMGAGVGLMQWLALRDFLPNSQRMFWGTFIGFSFAFVLRDFIDLTISFPMTVEATIPFAVLLGSSISGWIHYKFLFGKIMDKAVNWIFYNSIAWLLAAAITIGLSLLNFRMAEYFPKAIIFILALLMLSIGGPVLGYITGRFIVNKINVVHENNIMNE